MVRYQLSKIIGLMAFRTTVVAATNYSDLAFLVFTQSGPFSEVQYAAIRVGKGIY